ncbi:lysophospholipid acyltransferase 7 [Planococcus citri]|uniref:lysophospholipid acyltransferase 7 n=1 Tax=Planococcus citri TaxID=170843 RepID=UPI0031F75CB8
MDYEDIIYLAVLIGSIFVGYFFQKIQSPETKRWFSTILGTVICTVVCGFHVLHGICVTLTIGLIIKFSYRYCHGLSFAAGFLYLVFFRTTEYFNIPYPTGHANMIQMILTLKLVGLAFEVHDNHVTERKMKKDEKSVTDQDIYRLFPKPSILEVFHYAFCYAGVLTGPYFTYCTYRDMLKYPLKECKLHVQETLKIVAYVPLFSILYLGASKVFPLHVLFSDEFYNQSPFPYRLWYMYSTFFIFRMRMYIAFRLSEAVCIMAGLGLYPVSTKPRAGSGPSCNFEALSEMNKMSSGGYNFETIDTIRVLDAEFSTTVREATRYWNRSIQYWLAAYVYRRFPFKKYKTLMTFFISSFWHGIHAGYYFSLFSVPLYLFVEDTFVKRVIKHDQNKLKNFLLWNAKMFQFSYWGLAFQVKDSIVIWKYGMSVYFAPYIVAIVMYFVAVLIK